jgi:hypothetical protein
MEPRWRPDIYSNKENSLAYLGGTKYFDVSRSCSDTGDKPLIWIVWADAPFHWETFRPGQYVQLKENSKIHDGGRLTPKRKRELDAFLMVFVPEFWEQVELLRNGGRHGKTS